MVTISALITALSAVAGKPCRFGVMSPAFVRSHLRAKCNDVDRVGFAAFHAQHDALTSGPSSEVL